MKPSLVRLIRCLTFTIGTTTAESAITVPRINTIMLGLPYLLITDPITLKKTAMPILDQNPIQKAYMIGRLSKSQKVKVLRNALNMIMYMPVEAATYGGTPIPINIGLNTMPPPSPTALARPPPIEQTAN